MKKPIKIPFNANGDLVDYANYGYSNGCVWKDNYEFDTVMQFTGFARGRSAAHARFLDDNGRHYSVFLTDLDYILKHSEIKFGGLVSGKWTFQKRGTNFGVRLVK